MAATDGNRSRRALMREIRARHPRLREAVFADAQVTASYRGERSDFRSPADAILQALRLMWVSDAFLAQVLYRIKARLQGLGVPIVPRVAHRLAMITGQVAIGDPVVIEPGIYIVHGQVVIDGLVEIRHGAILFPFVTVGLRAGNVVGATIEAGVSVGTGAKVIGRVRLGEGSTIGANAVVVDDVAPGTTVVGAPARPVRVSGNC